MKKVNNFFEKAILEPLQGIIAILLYYLFWCLRPETASWLGGKLALFILNDYYSKYRSIKE